MTPETDLVERMMRLIRALADSTAGGRVSWQPTDEPTSFLTSLEHGSVLVESVDSDGVAPFRVSILNRDGVVVETISTTDDAVSTVGQFQELHRLYQTAKRQSFAVDETIDGLLNELE